MNARMTRRWLLLPLVAVAGLLTGLTGCGQGSPNGTDNGGEVLAPERGVPTDLTISSGGALNLLGGDVGGDDYLLVLTSTSEAAGPTTVTLNDGTTALPMLQNAAAAARPVLPFGHLPIAARHPRCAPIAAVAAMAEQVGSQRDFAYEHLDGTKETLTTTLRAVTAHGLLYVDNRVPDSRLSDEQVDDVAAEWESVIYPGDIGWFGAPSDVDSNNAIVVLMTPAVLEDGLDGFFDPSEAAGGVDQITVLTPTEAYPFETIRGTVLATLVHEFQHLIHYNYKAIIPGDLNRQDDSWIDEGMAWLAIDLAGYSPMDEGVYYGMDTYLEAPEQWPLFEFTGDYGAGHTGSSFLFFRYVADRFGTPSLKAIVQSEEIGVPSIQGALGEDFAVLMREWAAMLALDDTGLTSDARFGLSSYNLHGVYDGGLGNSYAFDGAGASALGAASGHPAAQVQLPRGGARYVRLTSPGPGNVSVLLKAPTADLVRVQVIRVPAAPK